MNESPHLQLKRAAREIDARLSNGQPITREAHEKLIAALVEDGGRNTDELAPITVTVMVTPRSNQRVIPVVADMLEMTVAAAPWPMDAVPMTCGPLRTVGLT